MSRQMDWRKARKLKLEHRWTGGLKKAADRILANKTPSPSMTVIRNENRAYHVVGIEDRHLIKGGFLTESSAWKWIDEHDDTDGPMRDRARRIQTAFSER